ncbi:phosphatidic acid phosphatase [Achlya hypogyna]|uniref:Phosphatidic acid phosphatase n=1 Tax=Achlya hypogyna TaxID=1202772 RepID=A0A1V9ZJZ6_ACHHY|nr:phosphatidic acid phosphatase [Achlya hypogyna]
MPSPPLSWINRYNHGADFAVVKFFHDNCGSSTVAKLLWEIITFTGDGIFFFAVLPPVALLAWAMGALPRLSQDQVYLTTYLGVIIILDFLLNLAMKACFRRHRPSYHKHDMRFPGPDKYSFPSGHATRVGCLLAWIVELVKYEPRLLTVALSSVPYMDGVDAATKSSEIVATGIVWVVMNCIGRLALGRHFASDVVCGALLGYLVFFPAAQSLMRAIVHPTLLNI